MSTCWYFHTFPWDRLAAVFGGATSAVESQLMQFVEDPDEGFEDDDEREVAVRLARHALGSGLSYDGLSKSEKGLLDQVVKMAFHDMGLADALKLEPVSREPITLNQAEAIVRQARARGLKLLPVLADGRRLRTDERPSQPYFILEPSEVVKMRDELGVLLADSSIQWPVPHLTAWVRSHLLSVLDNAAGKSGLAVYATLT